jgi:hypothetical protein
LADAFLAVGVPCSRLVDDLVQNPQFDNFAFVGNAFAIQNIKIGIAKRRSDFVFDYLGPRFTSSPFLILPIRRISMRTEA